MGNDYQAEGRLRLKDAWPQSQEKNQWEWAKKKMGDRNPRESVNFLAIREKRYSGGRDTAKRVLLLRQGNSYLHASGMTPGSALKSGSRRSRAPETTETKGLGHVEQPVAVCCL